MSLFNKVIICNLTRKPELRQTQSQTSVTTLSIATNDRRKNASGEYENVAEYHDEVVVERLVIRTIWTKVGSICRRKAANA